MTQYSFAPGNSANGIDFPDMGVDIKVTSIKQPQSSCPFKSARQKIFGLGYCLLVFVYEKADDRKSKSAVLNFLHTVFVEKEQTADFQMTTGLLQILENKGNGLNLTVEVLDGIGKHSKGRREILPEDLSELPASMEGRVVRIADIIAYVNHDLDDAMRAGMLSEDRIPGHLTRLFGTSHSMRIRTMVNDLVVETLKTGGERLTMQPHLLEGIAELRSFLFKNVYETHRVHDDFPAGYVSLAGDFFAAHEQEMLQLIHHHEAQEKANHPLQRIMAIEKTQQGTLITTTDIHLARGIGDALHHAYQGELEFHYNPDQNLLRVNWNR